MTDPNVLASLAAKLESLDLTAAEREALEEVLDRAASAGPEVEGFGVVFEVETTFKGSDEELQLTDLGGKLGRALGFRMDTGRYIGETEKN